MDDFALFSDDKSKLRHQLTLIEEYLAQTLQLKPKKSTRLNRCSLGLTFLGYRVFPGGLRLSARSRNRFARKFKLYERLYALGLWDEETLARHVEPLIQFTRHAHANGFRRAVLARYGVRPEARTA